MFVYVEHVKDSNVRFQVVEFDAATKQGTLVGEYGAKFTRDLSKEALKKYGYKIVQSEAELPLMSSRPGTDVKKKGAAPEDDPPPPARKSRKVTTPEEEE